MSINNIYQIEDDELHSVESAKDAFFRSLSETSVTLCEPIEIENQEQLTLITSLEKDIFKDDRSQSQPSDHSPQQLNPFRMLVHNELNKIRTAEYLNKELKLDARPFIERNQLYITDIDQQTNPQIMMNEGFDIYKFFINIFYIS